MLLVFSMLLGMLPGFAMAAAPSSATTGGVVLELATADNISNVSDVGTYVQNTSDVKFSGSGNAFSVSGGSNGGYLIYTKDGYFLPLRVRFATTGSGTSEVTALSVYNAVTDVYYAVASDVAAAYKIDYSAATHLGKKFGTYSTAPDSDTGHGGFLLPLGTYLNGVDTDGSSLRPKTAKIKIYFVDGDTKGTEYTLDLSPLTFQERTNYNGELIKNKTGRLVGNQVTYTLSEAMSNPTLSDVYYGISGDTLDNTKKGGTAKVNGTTLTVTLTDTSKVVTEDKTTGKIAGSVYLTIKDTTKKNFASYESKPIKLDISATADDVTLKLDDTGDTTQIDLNNKADQTIGILSDGVEFADKLSEKFLVYINQGDTGVSGSPVDNTYYSIAKDTSNSNRIVLTIKNGTINNYKPNTKIKVLALNGAFKSYYTTAKQNPVTIDVIDSSGTPIPATAKVETTATNQYMKANVLLSDLSDRASDQEYAYYTILTDTVDSSGKITESAAAKAKSLLASIQTNTNVGTTLSGYDKYTGTNTVPVTVKYDKDGSIVVALIYKETKDAYGSTTYRFDRGGYSDYLDDGIADFVYETERDIAPGKIGADFVPISLVGSVTGGSGKYVFKKDDSSTCTWLDLDASKTSIVSLTGKYPTSATGASKLVIQVNDDSVALNKELEGYITFNVGEVSANDLVTATVTGPNVAFKTGDELSGEGVYLTVKLTGGEFKGSLAKGAVIFDNQDKVLPDGVEYSKLVRVDEETVRLILTTKSGKVVGSVPANAETAKVSIGKSYVTADETHSLPSADYISVNSNIDVQLETQYKITYGKTVTNAVFDSQARSGVSEVKAASGATKIDLVGEPYKVNAGYEITGWTVSFDSDATTAINAGKSTVRAEEAKLTFTKDSVTIAEDFIPTTFTVTPVIEKAKLEITVTPDGPAVAVGAAAPVVVSGTGYDDAKGTVTVEYGANLTLNVAVAEGYEVKSVTGGTWDATAKTITVSGANDSNKNIVIVYDKVKYPVTVTEPENGALSVTLNGTAVTEASMGDELTISAMADKGYKLEGITVDGTAFTGTTYTMTAKAVEIAATFAKDETAATADAEAAVTVNTTETGAVAVEAAIDETSAETLATAIASEDAAEAISLDMTSTKGADAAAVMNAEEADASYGLPTNVVEALASEDTNVATTAIATDLGDVEVKQDTMAKVAEAAYTAGADAKVTLAVSKSNTTSNTNVSSETKAAIKKSFNIDFKVGDTKVDIKDVAPVKLSFFVGKKLGFDPTIRFLADDGTLSETASNPEGGKKVDYNILTGMITFWTTHFSEYVLMDADDSPLAISEVTKAATPRYTNGASYVVTVSGTGNEGYLYIANSVGEATAGMPRDIESGKTEYQADARANTITRIFLSNAPILFNENGRPYFESEDGALISSYDSATGEVTQY